MKTKNNKNTQNYIAPSSGGINGGGHAVIKMSDLNKMFEQYGFKDFHVYSDRKCHILTSQADKSKPAGNIGFEYCKLF